MFTSNTQLRVVKRKGALEATTGNPVARNYTMGASIMRSQNVETAMNSNISTGSGDMMVNSLPQYNTGDTYLTGLLSDNDSSNLRYYRDIHSFDTIGGACADLMSSMPFSDFNLEGLEEKKLNIFQSSVEMLNLKTLMPEFALDHLVTGKFTATPIYSHQQKRFIDMICWDAESTSVHPSPLINVDPLITVKPNDALKKMVGGVDSFYSNIRSTLSPQMIDALTADNIELDPLITLYVPRKSSTTDFNGTSMFRRILPLYLIEFLDLKMQ